MICVPLSNDFKIIRKPNEVAKTVTKFFYLILDSKNLFDCLVQENVENDYVNMIDGMIFKYIMYSSKAVLNLKNCR